MSSISLRNRATLRRPERLAPEFPRAPITKQRQKGAPSPPKPDAPLPQWDADVARGLAGTVLVSADKRALTRDFDSVAWRDGMWVVPSTEAFRNNDRCRFTVTVDCGGSPYSAIGIVGAESRARVLQFDYGTDFRRYPMLCLLGDGTFTVDVAMSRRRCIITRVEDGETFRLENLPPTAYFACSMKHTGSCRIAPRV